MASPLTVTETGIRIAVRLTPKASRTAVQGLAEAADGGRVLRVSVTAPPEGGAVNVALIKLLAKEWRVPKSAIAIAAGATDRQKTLAVTGDPAALAPVLETWMEGLDER